MATFITGEGYTRADLVREGEEIDYFTELPPELVLRIINYLHPRHFLPCMCVSKAWSNILGGMEPYWKQSCLKILGLSQEITSKLQALYPTFKEMFYSALHHRRSICIHRPKSRQLNSGYPYYMHYICQYAKGNDLIGTVYKDFEPHKIIAERIENDAMKTVLNIYPSYPGIAENRTIWAHLHDHYLLCATASGIWSVYDIKITSGTMILQWKSQCMYDTDIRITCCDNCSMVCTAKLVSSHSEESFWELQVVEIFLNSSQRKLPMPKVTKYRLNTKNKEITSRRNRFGKKKITLLSYSNKLNSHGLCSVHILLTQWGNSIAGNVIMYNMDEKHSRPQFLPTPKTCYIIECDSCDYDATIIERHRLNTEFALSEDKRLLGTIFQSQLVTWNVQSSCQTSSIEISLDNYDYEEIKLISLGHIYSIIGLEFSSSILVIATKTGQVLLKCTDFAKQHSQIVPPFIVFFSTIKENWLSDITMPCRTMVTYWNKTSRAIEGVEFGEVPDVPSVAAAVTKSKKKYWWYKRVK